MNDRITVTNIVGINPDVLKMITIDNGRGRLWAITNKFNQITPFFENVPYMDIFDDKNMLIIGQIKGNKKIYHVHDTDRKEDNFCVSSSTIGDVVYLNNLDKNVAILTTDKGEYLFDKQTLKPKSDIFSSIAFLDNRLIFTKVMSHDGRDTHYYGDVNKEGKVGRFIYDEENDDFIVTPILEDSNKDYDIIDEFKLDEIYNDISLKRASMKKAKLKILSRLNMVRE